MYRIHCGAEMAANILQHVHFILTKLNWLHAFFSCPLETSCPIRSDVACLIAYLISSLSPLLRAGGKPHEFGSHLIRLSFDPPNFLRHASMHLLSHQVSAKLLLRLEPEWLR